MADIKAQLKSKNGDNLYPVTSMAYVTATFNGGLSFNSSTNTLSTYRIPIASVSALTTSLSAKQATCSAGFRTEINGATVSQKRYFDIENLVSGGTVTVSAGCAYRIAATTAAGVTLVSEPVTTGQFGLEGHATIVMLNSSYLYLGSNVVLGQPLMADAANNCTLRFHDGHCVIDVEDHVAAYTVVNTSTGATTSGSLAYGLKLSGSILNDYIGFNTSLNTSSVPTGGQSATTMKHLVGNGMDVGPTITGNLSIPSGATIRDIKVNGLVLMNGNATLTDVTCSNLVVSSGTTTLDNVYIPNGAVVSATGGTAGGFLYIKDVRLDGTIDILADTVVDSLIGSGTIDLGLGNTYNHRLYNQRNKPLVMSGITVSRGYSANWGAQVYIVGGTSTLTSCTFADCRIEAGKHGVIGVDSNGKGVLKGCTFNNNRMLGDAVCIGGYAGRNYSYELESCVFSSNNTPAGKCACFMGNASGTIVNSITDCEFQAGQAIRLRNNAIVELHGSNTIDQIIDFDSTNSTGRIVIAPSSIIDLTGNTNATPINLSTDITFPAGGATVYPSAGPGHAYMLDNVSLPAGAALTNTNVINMNNTFISTYQKSASVSGCVFSGGLNVTGGGGGVYYNGYGKFSATDCVFVGNTATSSAGGTANGAWGGAVHEYQGSSYFSNCVFSSNYCRREPYAGALSIDRYAKLDKCSFYNNTGAFAMLTSARVDVSDCYFGPGQNINLRAAGDSLGFSGSNTFLASIKNSGTVTLTSGAIFDVTGTTVATPIICSGNGKIAVETGGATVINSAGTAVSIAGGTYTKINKDGTTA